jgi:hypothetical protein
MIVRREGQGQPRQDTGDLAAAWGGQPAPVPRRHSWLGWLGHCLSGPPEPASRESHFLKQFRTRVAIRIRPGSGTGQGRGFDAAGGRGCGRWMRGSRKPSR